MNLSARPLARIASRARRPLAAVVVATALAALPPPALGAHGAGPTPGRLRERALDVCFTAAPAGWAGTLRASLPTTLFAPATVSPNGDRAYGYTRDSATGEQGIAAVDLRTGALTALVALPPDSSGLLSLAVDAHWIAWVQGDSRFDPNAWTLHARSLDTGEQLTLATSRLPDGTPLFGQQPLLALERAVVTWAQPTSTSGPIATAEVRAYDLAARRLSILDSGRVSSPVFAGTLVVWGRIGDGATVLRAVHAATLTPVELPEQVRSQPGILYLAGSRHYLVWSTDRHHAVAWRFDGGRLTSYAIAETGDVLQFLTVAGHFLIWFAGSSFAVLDLETGGAFDAAVHGRSLDALAGSDAVIVRGEPLDTGGKVPTGTTVSSLRTATAPGIPGCAA